MLVIALLLAVPLGMRYLTVWKMRHLRSEIQLCETEYQRLREQHGELMQQSRDVRKEEREFAVRRSRLYAAIHTVQQELRKVNAPVSGRMAA